MLDRDSFVFQGSKLKLARELRMLTLAKVAEEIEVSHQIVSAWENNKRIPSFENLNKLEELLKFPRRFFYAPSQLDIDGDLNFFRKSSAVALKYQVQVKRISSLFSLIAESFKSHVKLPEFQMPKYANFNDKFFQIEFSEIELIATKLRNQLSLGLGPISNLTLAVERLGIRVHFEDLSSSKIDAMTDFKNNQPYIIINKSRLSSVRIRFNIAHELGHILLHSHYGKMEISNKSNHKRIEAEANYFAGCFLLPEEGFVLDLSSTNMNHLVELKKHWKVSLQAIIYRGEQLNIIGSRQTLFLRQQISRNKWRYLEPYDDIIAIEYPTLFNKAIEFLSKEKPSSINDIINDVGINHDMLKQMLNYNNKLVDLRPNTIPKLKLM
ncbi:ImmA/IrrE family metallo-endopeptidase [Marinilactibacillus psychrotolerans]|uniref:ImmA/IrrE family metallo-endopeptidase n=1 Tax=Marinilactibacillus psychrotolerans TaxID=191770 RepID=UPI00388A2B9A